MQSLSSGDGGTDWLPAVIGGAVGAPCLLAVVVAAVGLVYAHRKGQLRRRGSGFGARPQMPHLSAGSSGVPPAVTVEPYRCSGIDVSLSAISAHSSSAAVSLVASGPLAADAAPPSYDESSKLADALPVFDFEKSMERSSMSVPRAAAADDEASGTPSRGAARRGPEAEAAPNQHEQQFVHV